MKFFEFYFNPKYKEHTRYENFFYAPEKASEKRLGYLGISGELNNILPPNMKLLEELAQTIKISHYSPETSETQNAFQKALSVANKFLESKSKGGNVSWLGNLHLAILCITGDALSLTKIGKIKILLSRNGEIIDIGRDLERQNMAPSSLNILSHIISGKISEGDNLIILTPEIFQFFEAMGIMGQLAYLPEGKEYQKIKEVLKPYQKELKDYSGLLSMALVDKIEDYKPSAQHKKISIPIALSERKNSLAKRVSAIKKIKMPAIKAPQLPSLKIAPKLILKPGLPKAKISKKHFLILALAAVLIVGFTVAQIQKKKSVDEAEKQLLQIQQKMWQAQNHLISQKTKEANFIFQEVVTGLASLENYPVDKAKIQKLKFEAEKNLAEINNLNRADDIEPLLSVKEDNFNPQFLLSSAQSLYFLEPGKPKLYSWNLANLQPQTSELTWTFDVVGQLQDFLLFYQINNKLLVAGDGRELKLFPPYVEFAPSMFAGFRSNIYFLDQERGQIVKYEFLNLPQIIPTIWTTQPDRQRLSQAVSMAIDGSVWILDKSGSIHRYWGGSWQETLDVVLWPKLSRPTKMLTSSALPYLYILEPAQKRIVVLDKKGNPVKQYLSEAFSGLKDFAVSLDGKTIYLLNEKLVYKIDL